MLLLFSLNLDATSVPLLIDLVVASDGDSITLTYSEAVTFGAGGNGGLALTASGGAVTATYSSGDTTTALVYSLSRTIDYGESITSTYTQPGNGIEAVDDNVDVNSFTNVIVTNTSRINRPDNVTVGRFRRR